MGFIKFTGPFLNEEFNSFFRTFGYTQMIDIDTPPSLTTANQFSEQYLRLYTTSEKIRGYGNNRRTIPAQNIPDYEPLKIINLWSVWADIQEKPIEKQKFYLMDNKLLFFWVPRTKQDYVFKAGDSDGFPIYMQAQFGKATGGWFCLHRSPIADEEGNFPLKFGLPVEYKILGIAAEQGNNNGMILLKEDEFAEMESFKGIAYNWDFQGGILYRSYGQVSREAAAGNMTRILENIDWYATINRKSNNNFKPVKFKYPHVISPGLRRASPATKLSSINDKLKRNKHDNGIQYGYIGREFTATCVTERNLKSLMSDLENQDFQVTYSLPTASYQSDALFHPTTIGAVLRNAGLNTSLSTTTSGSGNRRQRETVDGQTPIGFTTKITFDPESCLPLFSGRTESAWKRQRSSSSSSNEYGNIINYNYRIPQILR